MWTGKKCKDFRAGDITEKNRKHPTAWLERKGVPVISENFQARGRRNDAVLREDNALQEGTRLVRQANYHTAQRALWEK